MGNRKFANNANSTLAAGIAAGDTICNVATGEGAKFPSLAAGEFFLATIEQGGTAEIVKVTSRATDQLTIVRAQEGTTAAVFSAGAAIELRWTAGAAQTACYLDGDNAFTGRILLAKGTDLASGTMLSPGSDGNYFVVTGTATINGLAALQAGAEIELRFAGACTLTHNATSFILQGGTNYTTAAGDVLRFRSEGSGNWREVNRHTASPTATTHEMLSATHTDSVVDSVARGDLMVGNATPKWGRKALGSANQVLYSNGVDLVYGQVTTAMLAAAVVRQGQLSTSTGSASGVGGMGVATGQPYTFAGAYTNDSISNAIMGAYGPIGAPNNSNHYIALNVSGGGGTSSAYWRYINSSANPALYVILDDEDGTIIATWEAEDPCSDVCPPIMLFARPNLQAIALPWPDDLLDVNLDDWCGECCSPDHLGDDDEHEAMPHAPIRQHRMTIKDMLAVRCCTHPELREMPKRLTRIRKCWALRAVAQAAGMPPALHLLTHWQMRNGVLRPA